MGRKHGDPNILEGDIVVTAVPDGNYMIRRVNADHKEEMMSANADPDVALARACEIAGEDHRVFIRPFHGKTTYYPHPC